MSCLWLHRRSLGTSVILAQEKPPAPQSVLVGPSNGFDGLLAWCTRCPAFPPAVTGIHGSGNPRPYAAMPELPFLPFRVIQRALERISDSAATSLGRDSFLELVQQLPPRGES